MAFLAFHSADVFHCYTIHFPRLIIVVEFFIDAVKLIAGAVIKVEVHFCLAVTVHAPAHAQFGRLGHHIHFLDIAVAGLAGYIAYAGMLGMVEIYMVGKVMNLDPLR